MLRDTLLLSSYCMSAYLSFSFMPGSSWWTSGKKQASKSEVCLLQLWRKWKEYVTAWPQIAQDSVSTKTHTILCTDSCRTHVACVGYLLEHCGRVAVHCRLSLLGWVCARMAIGQPDATCCWKTILNVQGALVEQLQNNCWIIAWLHVLVFMVELVMCVWIVVGWLCIQVFGNTRFLFNVPPDYLIDVASECLHSHSVGTFLCSKPSSTNLPNPVMSEWSPLCMNSRTF